MGPFWQIACDHRHPDNRWNPIRGILNTVVTGVFHTDGLMDFKCER